MLLGLNHQIEIESFERRTGMSLEDITQSIRNRVEKKSAVAAIIKFDFGDDGLLSIDGSSSPAVVSNDDIDADCTVIISLSDFEEILAGSLNPQMAFMMGKLKVEGEMGIALQLGEILG